MNFSEAVLRNDEKAIYSLRELYSKFGYMPYKVNKFEEYDLYAHNKNFLVSDKVLAFTDTNGKLMALKPDVTLSIIKNVVCEDNAVNKLYYNEYKYVFCEKRLWRSLFERFFRPFPVKILSTKGNFPS